MALKRPGVSDTCIMADKQVLTLRTPAAPALPTLLGEIDNLVFKMGHTLPAECVPPVVLTKIEDERCEHLRGPFSFSSQTPSTPGSERRFTPQALLRQSPGSFFTADPTAAGAATAITSPEVGSSAVASGVARNGGNATALLLPSRLQVSVYGCSVKAWTAWREADILRNLSCTLVQSIDPGPGAVPVPTPRIGYDSCYVSRSGGLVGSTPSVTVVPGESSNKNDNSGDCKNINSSGDSNVVLGVHTERYSVELEELKAVMDLPLMIHASQAIRHLYGTLVVSNKLNAGLWLDVLNQKGSGGARAAAGAEPNARLPSPLPRSLSLHIPSASSTGGSSRGTVPRRVLVPASVNVRVRSCVVDIIGTSGADNVTSGFGQDGRGFDAQALAVDVSRSMGMTKDDNIFRSISVVKINEVRASIVYMIGCEEEAELKGHIDAHVDVEGVPLGHVVSDVLVRSDSGEVILGGSGDDAKHDKGRGSDNAPSVKTEAFLHEGCAIVGNAEMVARSMAALLPMWYSEVTLVRAVAARSEAELKVWDSSGSDGIARQVSTHETIVDVGTETKHTNVASCFDALFLGTKGRSEAGWSRDGASGRSQSSSAAEDWTTMMHYDIAVCPGGGTSSTGAKLGTQGTGDLVQPDRAGWLFKSDGGIAVGDWQRSYCVLKGNILFLADGPSALPHSKIDLTQAIDVIAEDAVKVFSASRSNTRRISDGGGLAASPVPRQRKSSGGGLAGVVVGKSGSRSGGSSGKGGGSRDRLGSGDYLQLIEQGADEVMRVAMNTLGNFTYSRKQQSFYLLRADDRDAHAAWLRALSRAVRKSASDAEQRSRRYTMQLRGEGITVGFPQQEREQDGLVVYVDSLSYAGQLLPNRVGTASFTSSQAFYRRPLSDVFSKTYVDKNRARRRISGNAFAGSMLDNDGSDKGGCEHFLNARSPSEGDERWQDGKRPPHASAASTAAVSKALSSINITSDYFSASTINEPWTLPQSRSSSPPPPPPLSPPHSSSPSSPSVLSKVFHDRDLSRKTAEGIRIVDGVLEVIAPFEARYEVDIKDVRRPWDVAFKGDLGHVMANIPHGSFVYLKDAISHQLPATQQISAMVEHVRRMHAISHAPSSPDSLVLSAHRFGVPSGMGYEYNGSHLYAGTAIITDLQGRPIQGAVVVDLSYLDNCLTSPGSPSLSKETLPNSPKIPSQKAPSFRAAYGPSRSGGGSKRAGSGKATGGDDGIQTDRCPSQASTSTDSKPPSSALPSMDARGDGRDGEAAVALSTPGVQLSHTLETHARLVEAELRRCQSASDVVWAAANKSRNGRAAPSVDAGFHDLNSCVEAALGALTSLREASEEHLTAVVSAGGAAAAAEELLRRQVREAEARWLDEMQRVNEAKAALERALLEKDDLGRRHKLQVRRLTEQKADLERTSHLDKEKADTLVAEALARVAKKTGAKQVQQAAAKGLVDAGIKHGKELEKMRRELTDAILERDQMRDRQRSDRELNDRSLQAKEAENAALRDQIAALQAQLFSSNNQLEVARAAEAVAKKNQAAGEMRGKDKSKEGGGGAATVLGPRRATSRFPTWTP